MYGAYSVPAYVIVHMQKKNHELAHVYFMTRAHNSIISDEAHFVLTAVSREIVGTAPVASQSRHRRECFKEPARR